MSDDGERRVRLQPMTWDEYDAWSEHSLQGFAAAQVSSGLQPEAEAEAYARQQLERLLPAGLATPLHLFFTVREEAPGEPTVGYLWLRVRPLSTEVEAFVFDVELHAHARGRGLGTATMLAAERAAREVGATVARLNVFGDNVPAMRLYEGLGYTVTSATMARRLDERRDQAGRPGDRTVSIRDMTDQEYDAFCPRFQADYARDIARSGTLPVAEAMRKAAADLGQLPPDGHAGLRSVGGHRLWSACDGDLVVGLVWVQLQERSDGRHAFGFDLEVDEHLRGRGYGRAVLRAVLEACRKQDADSVSLPVFGFNDPARTLYESEGFAVTAQTMAKRL